MRKTNLRNWEYNSDLENLLFTAQRLDEVLFFYTQDTYKANVLNTRMLIDEFLEVRDSIEAGLLNEKNDEAVVEEIIWSLERDKEATQIIGERVVENLKKNIGSIGIKERVKYFRLLQSQLSGKKYFNAIKNALKNAVRIEKKREIERLILQFVCEAKNQGYNTRYIYRCVNEIFFVDEVNSYETIDIFLNRFNGTSQKYIVYIEVNEEIGNICVNLTNALRKVNVELMEEQDIPEGIRVSGKKKVLKFQYIEALDNYAALESAQGIIKIMGHFYAFYRHNIEMSVKGGYTSLKGDKIIYVRPEVIGIKKSAKSSSLEKSTSSTKDLFNIARSNPMNFYILSRIMEIHNIAFGMDAPANSLLDLWSILELLLEKDKETGGKSRIFQIIDMLEPFIKEAYIEHIIVNIKNDIQKWDSVMYRQILNSIDIECDDNEKIFAFISLVDYDDLRKEVYCRLDKFPLLRYRIFNLHETFKSGKSIYKFLKEHEKKTAWHIQRIYRARNCIIHDGEDVQNIENLVENLHSYIAVLCSGIVQLLNNNNQNQTVMDAIYEMYIKEKLFEEWVENTDPTRDNVCDFMVLD